MNVHTMPTQAGTDPEFNSIGATTAWLTLSDGLLAGFCHELGGRASAFVSLAHLATRESVRAGFVVQEIERESEQLARLANLLRVLPRHASDRPRPVSLRTTLVEAVELARYHHGLRAIEFELDLDDDLPAFRVDRNAFIQSLLILIAASARKATLLHRDTLRFVGRTQGEGIRLTIESLARVARDSGPATWLDTPPPEVDETSLDVVRERWSEKGCHLTVSDDGFELKLPLS